MSGEEISDSRFYMWRAVFAMAHADGKVTPQERNFVDNYLKYVPFTDDQRATVANDLEEPQEVGAMLSLVSDPEDQAGFFEFARMLVWADGEMDQWEESAVQQHLDKQMKKFDLDSMAQDLKKLHREDRDARAAEYMDFKRDADSSLGLSGFVKKMVRR